MNRFIKVCFTSIWSMFVIGQTPLYAQDSVVNTKISYYQRKVKIYLDKENALSSFYTINKDGIKIFASSNDKAAGRFEFTVSWKEVEAFRKDVQTYETSDLMNRYSGHYDGVSSVGEVKTEAPSKNPAGLFYGYRIAIDAGHTAGTIEEGEVEQKFLKFNSNPDHGLIDSIQLAEG